MAGNSSVVYISECVKAVGLELGPHEYISRIEMGRLIPSRNAVFPFIVYASVMSASGAPTGENRAIFVEVTSNTPPQATIKEGVFSELSWNPV